MSYRYKFINPTLPKFEEILPYLKPAYEAGHFTNFGPACVELERRITAKFAKPDYTAISVTNATLGLQVVLESLDVRDKYVIVPDFTFPATFHAVIAAGGTPLICDVNLQTSELEPSAVLDAIAKYPNIGAVVPVRCFGLRRDLSPLLTICSDAQIPVLVDAAASLGDHRQPRFGSDFGEIEVFSLHTTKVFAAGEGGIILAPSRHADNLRRRTNFGLMEDRSFMDGTNAKMDEFRAAVGLATLSMLPDIIKFRSEHVSRLQEVFSGSSTITMFNVGRNQTWCNFPIYSRERSGEELAEHFLAEGVEVRRYYYPVVSEGYKDKKKFVVHSSNNASYLGERMLCIPVYSNHVGEDFFSRIGKIVEKLESQ